MMMNINLLGTYSIETSSTFTAFEFEPESSPLRFSWHFSFASFSAVVLWTTILGDEDNCLVGAWTKSFWSMFNAAQILKIFKRFLSYRIFKMKMKMFTNVCFVVEEFALDLYWRYWSLHEFFQQRGFSFDIVLWKDKSL